MHRGRIGARNPVGFHSWNSGHSESIPPVLACLKFRLVTLFGPARRALDPYRERSL